MPLKTLAGRATLREVKHLGKRGIPDSCTVTGEDKFYGRHVRRIDQAQGLVGRIGIHSICVDSHVRPLSHAQPRVSALHVPDFSLLSPAPGTRSTAVEMVPHRHYLKASRTGIGLSRKSNQKSVASTRPAPRTRSSSNGRYDAPGRHAWWSQPAFAATYLRVGWNHILEKTPTTCSIGQDRRGGGRGWITTCSGIMIIGGFLLIPISFRVIRL